MRLLAILACGWVAACTSGGVPSPGGPVFQEVPPQGSPTYGGQDFTQTIESAIVEGDGGPATAPLPPGVAPTPLDADTLNLTLYTIEQQKVDARIAEQQLLAARSQLVVIEPGTVPRSTQGVNIALYAQQTTNAVGVRVYQRGGGLGRGNCGRYRDADEAQRVFLANGGPADDRFSLDPDGDGFACGWDPTPYRLLKI